MRSFESIRVVGGIRNVIRHVKVIIPVKGSSVSRDNGFLSRISRLSGSIV